MLVPAAELADVCHAEGVALLVDEAHGGHLGFMQADTTTAAAAVAGQGSSSAMAGALAAGADVVMQSSHKVLTAMTQAAMLHARGTRVEPGRVSKALQVGLTASAASPVGSWAS
jgi:arginine/lysine/ornithine decarboxylase